MAAQSEDSVGGSRSYKVVSANFRDKEYPEGVLVFDELRSEMELRKWTGRRKKEETIIARFRIEPTASVLVDGPLLRVSELSVRFDSASMAQEIAELLRRPAKQRETTRRLAEGESTVQEFLRMREAALAFLSAMKVNPRKALIGAESLWPPDDTKEPLEAVYSGYSARLAVSLERMNSSLEATEKQLGASVVKRLYALAYTIGMVQDAVFRGDQELVQEIGALSELGITANVQDLRAGISAERLMQRAHPALAETALLTALLPVLPPKGYHADLPEAGLGPTVSSTDFDVVPRTIPMSRT